MAAAAIDAGDLPTRLRLQAGHCRRLGSELYAGLLLRAAEDAEAGGPVAAILAGHEGDPPDSMLALRLLGAVHRRVLERALPELAAHYGPGGGPGGLEAGRRSAGSPGLAWPAFRRALTEDAEAIRPLLDRPVQTNEVGRCAALLPGFLAVAGETGLPLRLLEVGASAGLNLRWDRYRYEAGGFAWGDPASPVRLRFELEGAIPRAAPVEIAGRRGCDRSPLDPTSEEGRLTLLSYLWPDQTNRLERVQAALGIAAALPVTIDRDPAAAWIERQLARPAEGVATVVFHSIVMQYLPAEEREAFERLVESAGRGADSAAPLAWLRMEADGDRAAVRLRTWPGGADRLLGRASYHGDRVDLRPLG
jgi:hypothetical protein